MPIEIKELVVKATLVEDGNRRGGNSNGSAGTAPPIAKCVG